MTGLARREELADRLAVVRRRIATACSEVERDPDEVTLVVVTKFFPASDVRLLADLGVRHVGENRHQEAERKAAECADLDLAWHFIGGLQSNKAAAVARYADVVESVDRTKLVGGLSRGAHERGRPLEVLVQVSLDRPGSGAVRGRSGVDPAALAELGSSIAAADGLALRGLMAVAPLGADPALAFAPLPEYSAALVAIDAAATHISAGMSGDLEAAVKRGATHVRVGSAILGNRPPIK